MNDCSGEKLSQFGTTIFAVMSQLAADHDAINLAQGFPDFDGPPELRNLVAEHMAAGHNQYAPLAGVPDLRRAIARKVSDLYGFPANPDTNVTVTPGATEAIYCAITAMVEAGDEVIILDPSYDSYAPNVVLNGGVPVRIPLAGPDFAIDWDKVRDAVSDRTRLIVLNSPHNPCGSCIGSADIEALGELLEKHPIHVVSDEVYEHICFDGLRHESLLRYPHIAERSFVISSFGKTYHVTGWRIGYCVASKSLTKRFERIHQFINYSTNAPLSYAIADFMDKHPEFHQELGQFYQAKRDLFCELLEGSRFELVPVKGTYFQTADYSAISDLPDVEFAHELTVNHKVAVIPISVFYDHPPEQRIIRFCFAKQDETLRRAAERLHRL